MCRDVHEQQRSALVNAGTRGTLLPRKGGAQAVVAAAMGRGWGWVGDASGPVTPGHCGTCLMGGGAGPASRTRQRRGRKAT